VRTGEKIHTAGRVFICVTWEKHVEVCSRVQSTAPKRTESGGGEKSDRPDITKRRLNFLVCMIDRFWCEGYTGCPADLSNCHLTPKITTASKEGKWVHSIRATQGGRGGSELKRLTAVLNPKAFSRSKGGGWRSAVSTLTLKFGGPTLELQDSGRFYIGLEHGSAPICLRIKLLPTAEERSRTRCQGTDGGAIKYKRGKPS